MLHQSCTVSLKMLDWFSVSALCINPHISLEKKKNMANSEHEEKGCSFVGNYATLWTDRLTHLLNPQNFHVNTQIFCVQFQTEIADRIETIQICSPYEVSEEAGDQTVKKIRNL